MNNNLNNIGTFIALRRKQLNLTQERLANMLGVSNKMVSNWENGRTAPDIFLLESLAKALETDVSNLLSCNNEIVIRKKSGIVLVIIIFFCLLVISSLGIFLNKKDEPLTKEYVISSTDQNNVLNGKVVISEDKTTFYIDEITITNKLLGTELEPIVSSLDFYIYQDEILFSSNYYYDKKPLNEAIKSLIIIADIDKKIDINENIYIRINYGSEIIIPIQFSEIENK